ncbi:putative ATP-dependent protease HslVU, ATPase subunit [Treponema socranskii subsp. socranskii VPI DR56BR1116 = ATCC 35536]|uniref:ATP-dependent protease ATPase subunit HslU n=1 Tax=Treponema socranskii subsp. socranskii VPI DR56BR1116 = ATCC 35536 TaxID=1125725 RepID=A0ABP2YP63_TRESO|nr:ATP-dependent protease ATPase subunit HslU [Treponema socranskii]ERK04951.1 putative ATP-dependent protease HslVU, ATPase subunit [Treponema socranskii subsp. socranskii VPI DR56BR1116 = ATCC 35536]
MSDVPAEVHTDLTPKEIVLRLDQYIIGQEKAKRAVAVALRNRYRRLKLPEDIRDEVAPKNILMIGPTGVGKTEIARRLAKLCSAPFLKVEATKYTEVGYVGRDVESMIRDLMAVGFNDVKAEMEERLREKSVPLVEDRLLDLLLPGSAEKDRAAKANEKKDAAVLGNIFTFIKGSGAESKAVYLPDQSGGASEKDDAQNASSERSASYDAVSEGCGASDAEAQSESRQKESSTREKFRTMLREGKLEEREVELTVHPQFQMPSMEIIAGGNMEDLESSMQSIAGMFSGGNKAKRRTVTIHEARKIISGEVLDTMIDRDKVASEAKKRVEQNGIIFIDEIDKIATKNGESRGQDVSREGVQRDILPIVEGSNVNTKYGVVDTSHILFIAAGAFSVSAPSDLIPELQGRFPLRVELDALKKDDFKKILTEPKNALTKQYVALLETEGVTVRFAEDAIDRMSFLAEDVNAKSENIGARRLHTIMEKVLDDISFTADEHAGETIDIDAAYVDDKLKDIVTDGDMSRYIL